jgi:predicted DNA-binding ribbon-helix-helix protein
MPAHHLDRPGPTKPVMVRISQEMWDQLAALARREESNVATVLRRLARERLEQLSEGGHEPPG